jgi:hypothetical protein
LAHDICKLLREPLCLCDMYDSHSLTHKVRASYLSVGRLHLCYLRTRYELCVRIQKHFNTNICYARPVHDPHTTHFMLLIQLLLEALFQEERHWSCLQFGGKQAHKNTSMKSMNEHITTHALIVHTHE